MLRLLSEADLALGRLDGSIEILPDADLFVFMYVRKEAVLSSQIEGTQSSLDDVLAAEAKILDRSRPSDVGEVLNYVAAMNLGLERLKTLPLSIRLIREIHERLLRGTRGRPSYTTPRDTIIDAEANSFKEYNGAPPTRPGSQKSRSSPTSSASPRRRSITRYSRRRK